MPTLEIWHFTSVKDAIQKFSLDSFDTTFLGILEYVKLYHKSQTILIESPYIDKHYTNELSNLYSKTFRHRKGYCTRLHFIEDSCTDLDDCLSKLDQKKLIYLGFLVIRPLAIGKVGQTLILPSHMDNFFYLCFLQKDIHLSGKTIKVRGIPFIEQDAMVISCAQASMWIIATFMHYAHSFPRQLPFEITDKATADLAYLGRSIPSSGLTTEQIVSGFNNMGYSPVCYYKPQKNQYENIERFSADELLWRPAEKVYSYIESEIPILIGFPDHTCTIVGHKMYDRITDINITKLVDDVAANNIKNDVEPIILSAEIFIDAFIIHDDQTGIYQLLPRDSRTSILLKKNYQNLLPKSQITSYQSLEDIDSIIVPLPNKIYLTSEDVYKICKPLLSINETRLSLIEELIKQRKENIYANKILLSLFANNNDPAIIRTYFLKSSRFKKLIKENKNIYNMIKKHYLKMDMPKFIWVAEISTYLIYGGRRCILGEIVLDPTANKYDFYGSILSIHLPGYFYSNKLDSDSLFIKNVQLETPYQILVRYDKRTCEIE